MRVFFHIRGLGNPLAIERARLMKEVLSVVSGTLVIVSYLPYITKILRHGGRPSRSSWFIWATVESLTLWGMYEKEAVNGLVAANVVGSWFVFGLSLKYGSRIAKSKDEVRADTHCVLAAMMGMLLWWGTGNPTVGIFMTAFAAVIAVYPTMMNSLRDPNHESLSAWVLMLAGCIVAFFAVPHWTVADTALAFAYLITDTVMVYILVFRPLIQARIA